jgi:UDP-N-acetyl-2-amino-2-deoxyglucuronate dehydrogenase
MTVLGIAIVGCGQIVTHHVAALLRINNDNTNENDENRVTFQVRALCDPSAERRQIIEDEVCGVELGGNGTTTTSCTTPSPPLSRPKHYDTLKDLIADTATLHHEIDIIFIAVPHDLHKEIACQALDATKTTITTTTSTSSNEPVNKNNNNNNNNNKTIYVVLEKPLAVTPIHLQELVTASQESGHRLIVAEQSPFWQEVQKAAELIHRDGAIGTTLVSAASFYYESMRDNVTSGSVNIVVAAAATAGDETENENTKEDDDDNKNKGASASASAAGLGWRGSLERAGGGIAMDGGLHWIRPLREILQRRIGKVVGVTRCNLAPELQMEGESVGHALLEMEEETLSSSSSSSSSVVDPPPPGAGPLIATYSCVMLATAPMAHDICPYFRITGNQGEIIIHGNGLFQQQPGAGGVRLYNDQYPTGQELFPPNRQGGFFLGFQGLWRDIGRIVSEQDAVAAQKSVLRAADDVQVVLALYRSAKSRQWEDVAVTRTSTTPEASESR